MADVAVGRSSMEIDRTNICFHTLECSIVKTNVFHGEPGSANYGFNCEATNKTIQL
jgi:hypothetical protein